MGWPGRPQLVVRRAGCSIQTIGHLQEHRCDLVAPQDFGATKALRDLVEPVIQFLEDANVITGYQSWFRATGSSGE